MCPDVAKLAPANTLSPWPRAISFEIPPSQRWARVTATPRNWFSLSRRGRIRLRRRAIWPCMTSASGCTSCPARSRSGKLGREAVRAPHGPALQGPTARRCPCVRAGWGANYRKTAASDSAGKERSRPACGARSRPTSSGQRHRPPCNVAAPAGLPVERRQLRLRPRSCRQSSRAKTSPRSAPQVAARRRHRHRPQASATGQATTRPSAATSPAPSSSPATGQAGAAPSSAAVVAVANRVARAVGPLHTTC